MKIMITGGTAFVSKYTAAYFADLGHEVYVLNRNTKPQLPNVKLVAVDRHAIGEAIRDIHFDAVLDITAYDAADIDDLCRSLGDFDQYIMISSSAVYPQSGTQPFKEETLLGPNKFWGKYGTDKIEAEATLPSMVKDAYILRPPYLYGAMNNVYREAFVFDCASADRSFYLTKDGDMKLQFFHVRDLCRIMEFLINNKPQDHIINVGNKETITIKDWVAMGYATLGKTPSFVNVYEPVEQRNYFSFYNYEYVLDISRQNKLLTETISLQEGLKDSAKWYFNHQSEVKKKPFIDFINSNFIR